MTKELDVLIHEADEKKAQLTAKPPLAPDVEDAQQERFLFADIYNSLAIEGNALSEEEIKRVLTQDEVVPGKPLSDHLGVVGYRDAIIETREYVSRDTRITEHEIRKLHFKLLIAHQQASGQYRNYNLMIRGHRPTSYEKIPYKMVQLVDGAGNPEDEHPLKSIAFFHLRLEKIHPFGDGNGRVGRLVVNTMLAQAGYPPIIFELEQKQHYYQALEAYDGLNGNPRVEPMQLFLTTLVIKQLDTLLELT
ncbi:MAG: Fic family protein [Coriobacteriales bacterium]|jgi:Fic family protein|nr:Fic family protein [Coriobacteriales bacterium]